MSAPWVMEARYMAELDAEEVRRYARDRRSAQIAADPQSLAAALANREDNDRWLLQLARVLTAIYAGGEQATPAQTLQLAVAIQALAEDSAREWS